MSDASQNYHHGDLRATLLRVATERVVNEGIDSLSLRKLAEEAGVSRTAPYHHFKDKNALLNAIAAQGFACTARRLAGKVFGHRRKHGQIHACRKMFAL